MRSCSAASHSLSPAAGISRVLVLPSVWNVFDAPVSSLQCSHHHPGRSVGVRTSLRSCVGAAPWQVWPPPCTVSLPFSPCPPFSEKLQVRCSSSWIVPNSTFILELSDLNSWVSSTCDDELILVLFLKTRRVFWLPAVFQWPSLH